MQLFSPKYRTEEILDALRPVLNSGWTGTGPQCKLFEEDWNAFIGSQWSVFVSSCTAALHLALKLQNIPRGHAVLTTPITFVSSNAAILYSELEPVFCDVDPEYMSLDPEKALDILKEDENIRIVMWVHYGGQVHPGFEDFVYEARMLDVSVIEDCAHAAGAFYPDSRERVGSRRDTISCFSFHAVKNLPTFDGGMICLRDFAEYERAKRLSWMGISNSTFGRTNDPEHIYKWRYFIEELGWKYNGNDVAATIGRISLKYLDVDNAYRVWLHNTYKEIVEGGFEFIKQDPLTSSCHLIAGRSQDRERLIQRLKSEGIAPGVHYTPSFRYKPFKLYYSELQCPNAEQAEKELISLPNHMNVTRDDVQKIARIIEDVRRD